MHNRFERTKNLIGDDAMKKLSDLRVGVFGIGGVGGYVVEALCRSGIGAIDIFDKDVVDETNINRQIIADTTTIGIPKVDVMTKRILDINPDCKVTSHNMFYLPQTADEVDLKEFDYVIDAVDTVTAKVCLIVKAHEAEVPIISSMGTAGRLDPTCVKVGDLYETRDDGLARVMRHECRKRGIEKLKVVYSTETAHMDGTDGSVIFVPSVAGLVIASEVVKDLISGIERS